MGDEAKTKHTMGAVQWFLMHPSPTARTPNGVVRFPHNLS
jgi:hypothetical protein